MLIKKSLKIYFGYGVKSRYLYAHFPLLNYFRVKIYCIIYDIALYAGVSSTIF